MDKLVTKTGGPDTTVETLFMSWILLPIYLKVLRIAWSILSCNFINFSYVKWNFESQLPVRKFQVLCTSKHPLPLLLFGSDIKRPVHDQTWFMSRLSSLKNMHGFGTVPNRGVILSIAWWLINTQQAYPLVKHSNLLSKVFNVHAVQSLCLMQNLM